MPRGDASRKPVPGTTVYDHMAADFDRRRPLPQDVPPAIRSAILAALPPRPDLLDLGCGAGRIGWPFAAAGDNYTAIDASLNMLRAFASRDLPQAPRLARADGTRLPFPYATFDAVVLVQVLSGVSGWRDLLREIQRVLRPGGVLFVGQSVAPENGLDARMKQHLSELLDGMDVHPYRRQPKQDAFGWLADNSALTTAVVARWPMGRTPREFMERHGNGARFSVLDPAVKAAAMSRLADWASATFGTLDAVSIEEQCFELRTYRHIRGL